MNSPVFGAAASFMNVFAWGDQGYGDELFKGALLTLEISVLAFVFGTALGFLAAVGKLSGPPWLVRVLNLYTTVFRALPELLLILLLYYSSLDALNQLFALAGLGSVALSGFATAIFVLGFVHGAYCAEVIRAAIIAIPHGQLEAAAAFGMSRWLRFRRITLPLLLPNALPGLGNLWLGMTKNSALVSLVGATELALITQQVAGETKRYFLVFLVSQLIYLLISVCSLRLFRVLENRMRRGQPVTARRR